MTDDDKWKAAIKWVRSEMTKRTSNGNIGHRSHVAAEVLEEAEIKFDLPSTGVEGWCNDTGSHGVQYLNMGDPYTPTICIQAGAYWHRCSLTPQASFVR